MSRTGVWTIGRPGPSGRVAAPVASVAFRRRLWQLALGLVLPLVCLAGAGLVSAYQAEQEATKTLLRETTRALAGTVDRELAKAEATLRALAESHHLRTGDLAAFHERADRLTAGDSSWVFLATAGGTPLLNTGVPFGTPLPRSKRVETFRGIAETGRAELSDVFTGTVAGRPIAVLEIAVPDRLHGETLILGKAMTPDLFQRIVDDQRLPETWNGAVVDGSGQIVARSRGTEHFAGQPVRPVLIEAMREATEGVVESTTLDGVPSRSFFSRSPTYGWTFVIGYPEAKFTASMMRSFGWLGALLLAVAVSVAVAVIYARSLLEPVDRLAEAARALGRGQPVDRRPTGVEELDVIASALAEAERDLARRDRDREEAQARIRDSEAVLRLALEAGQLGAWTYDPADDMFDLSGSCAGLYALPGDRLVPFSDVVARLHAGDRPRLRAALTEAVSTRGSFEISVRVLDEDGMMHWIDLRGRHLDRPGRPGLVGVGQDVTEHRAAEERQRLLLHELNHRVKNTLATVQSIATMTRRGEGEAEAHWQRFFDRLDALAKTHDLLTVRQWTGAPLRDLLGGELAPYSGEGGARIALDGPCLTLPPRAVLALGLVVHELATNAAKYGALGVESGTLDVTWRLHGEGEAARLELVWEERGGPPVSPPSRKGFGSRLIERSVVQQLGGRIVLDYAPSGLRCVIDIPFEPIPGSMTASPEAAKTPSRHEYTT